MTLSIKHAFTSAVADSGNTALVQPSNWNAEHTIALAAGKVMGRDTSGAGAVQELPIAVDSSGNVGIGTSSPATKLNVYTGSATNTFLRINNTGGTIDFGVLSTGEAYGGYSSGTVYYGTSAANPALFYTNGSERMRINSSGNVGIGNSSPTAALHVYGNNGTYGLSSFFGLNGSTPGVGIGNNGSLGLIQGLTTATGTVTDLLIQPNGGNVGIGLTSILVGKLAVKNSTDSYVNGGLFLQRQANTNGWSILPTVSNDLYLGYNSVDKGYFSNSTGAYVALSDKTIKKDVVDISFGLDAVKSLRPVEYLMLEEDNGSQKHLGFLAQEAQIVLPSSVSEMQGGKLGMDKSEIIPVLVKAIQELSAEVEALKAKVGA